MVFIYNLAKNKAMHIGILRETKVPADGRVALTPSAAARLIREHPEFQISVESSEFRCFSDEEYRQAGLRVTDDISGCDLLIGIKEVSISSLLPGRTYMMFSHTGKKQPHNRELLKEILNRKITLVDYEYLKGKDGARLVGFGRWAGIVGAYNGLRGYGVRYKLYDLKPAHQCQDMQQLISGLAGINLPPVKILITGGGRVAEGAMEVLSLLNIKNVQPSAFLERIFDEPVMCRIESWDYVSRKEGREFDLQHFYYQPEDYEPDFYKYSAVADLFIACHYWDPRSPVLLDAGDYRKPDFNISVIADISCDIPGPIASTLRASSIDYPFYGYDADSGVEGDPFDIKNITVMAVDNLPAELPRDSSADFAGNLAGKVLPGFLNDSECIIENATIALKGELTPGFSDLLQTGQT
jgi:saccharopine dehydrogenase (NAD+, L-lysine forming)